jgi:hypothetical protein
MTQTDLVKMNTLIDFIEKEGKDGVDSVLTAKEAEFNLTHIFAAHINGEDLNIVVEQVFAYHISYLERKVERINNR